MDEYEIRVVTANGRTSHHFASVLPSDFAAIRRAHAVTRPGQGVEVWRGSQCIYANHHDHPLMMSPHSSEVSADDEGIAWDYEIRILRNDMTPSIIWKTIQASDNAAIRAGVRTASGHALEIWRDFDCIFRSASLERPVL